MNNRSILYLLTAVAVAVLSTGPAPCEEFSSAIKKPVEKSIEVRRKTQIKEDEWALLQEKLIGKLSALEEKNLLLREKKDALLNEAKARRAAVNSLGLAEQEILKISKEMNPFLSSLCDRLSQIVENGYPFLLEERRKTVDDLKTAVADEGTNVGEKFRMVMTALFSEAAYGNSIEVYRKRIEVEGDELTAAILRLGRIAIFFQSPDGNNSGFYDMASGAYRPLSKAFNKEIGNAVAMGEKRRTAAILHLPLGRIGK